MWLLHNSSNSNKMSNVFSGLTMMSGNKVVELQVEMRQNAEDMQSYLKELESWETDIKRKDEELRTGGRKADQVCCHWRVCFCLVFLVVLRISVTKDKHRCVVENTPTRAQQGLQKQNEAEEEENGDRFWWWWWYKSWGGAEKRFKDKRLWLSILGQVWRGKEYSSIVTV